MEVRISENTEQPGLGFFDITELGKFLLGLAEGFLSQIFRVIRPATKTVRITKKGLIVFFH
jgi:hypothetical protein